MKLLYCALLLLLIHSSGYSQDTTHKISSKKFFTEESLCSATFTADLGALLNNKNKESTTKAVFSMKLPDSSVVSEEVELKPRGNFRLENCYIPPLKVDFKGTGSGRLSSLKSLKLVNGCSTGSSNDQLLIKEFLIYKMFNVLCEMSFRVRMMNITLEDSKKRKKTMTFHSFFIEDIDEMAKRNNCRKWDEKKKINTETTNREHMTFVSIFQYMIGNTDWSVPGNHNIRLISTKSDSLSRPYAIPYDFDYAGLVNAPYATPDEHLGTTSVLERVYRGFPRTMEELKTIIQPFRDKKDKIYAIVQGCELLSSRNKNEMIGYLDSFYQLIATDRNLKTLFIDNARSE
ncbi:MAG: hypothetical protein QM764_01625 [Chitinophagaceae bacterium]